MNVKILKCWKCKQDKSFPDSFYKDSHHKSGYQRCCKPCTKIANQKFHDSNPSYSSEYGKKRYAEIPDRKGYNKTRYKTNKQRYLNYNELARITPRGRLSQLYDAARNRAKRKSLLFELTLDWLVEQYERQNACCVLTNLPFDLKTKSQTKRHYNPYGPSIDQIIPGKGYTKDNVRLVLTAINIAMNRFDQQTFNKIVKSYLEKQGFIVQEQS